MSSLDIGLVQNFATAIFIGALVGVEREKRKERAGGAFGGLRTFILFALMGGIAAWLSVQLTQPWIFLCMGASVAGLLIAGYLGESRSQTEHSPGLTSEAAGMVVYLLGGACLYGYTGTAVALAVVTSGLLALKEPLHTLVEKINPDDLSAGLKLLFASFIVLPILPRNPVDPWGALNPSKLWLLVVLISGLSLAGYAAVRTFGASKGTVLTGALGGMVSSTAVTLSFAKASKEEQAGDALASGILLAWTVMFVRVLVEVAVVYPPMLQRILLPMLAMGTVAGGFAGFYYYHADRGGVPLRTDMGLKNPFSLSEAIRFALFFAVIMLAVKGVQLYYPGGGVYLVALLAGTLDVNAITLSMADSARDGSDMGEAVRAIVLATLANTVVKGGMVLVLASPSLRRNILIATAAILIVAAVEIVIA